MIWPSRRSFRNERGRREFLLSPMERPACAATETRNRLSVRLSFGPWSALFFSINGTFATSRSSFRASRAVPLPGVLSLPACGEAAGWTWANDETSPSLARQPNEKSKGNGTKDNQRQSECDANLEPLRK